MRCSWEAQQANGNAREQVCIGMPPPIPYGSRQAIRSEAQPINGPDHGDAIKHIPAPRQTTIVMNTKSSDGNEGPAIAYVSPPKSTGTIVHEGQIRPQRKSQLSIRYRNQELYQLV